MSRPFHRTTPSATTRSWRARSRRAGRTAGQTTARSTRPNPAGPLAAGFERVAGRPPLYVLDMFPYPSGAGLHVGHPLGYLAHRRVRQVPADDAAARPAHAGLRRLRAAGRAVRDRHRPAPPDHHRGEHRDHARPAAPAGARPRQRAARWPPPTRATTGGRSGSSCRSSTAGATSGPGGPGRSPSWSPSSRRGRARRPADARGPS